jgi:hypothetical protein
MESAEVVAFPRRGEVFVDQRGGGRALRLGWHTDAGVVVLSLWQDDRCTGSFRLPIADVPRLVHALVTGLVTTEATDRQPAPPAAAGT